MPSPYGLWIAFFSVLIFVAPNLVVLGLSGIDALDTVVTESTTMIVVNLIVGLVLQLVVFGLALLPLLAAGRPYGRLWGPTRTTGGMVGLGVVVGIGVAIVSYLVNIIVVVLAGVEEPVQQQLLQDALAGGLPLVLVVLLAVVVAPIVEEVIFRGVLFRALADRINLSVGLVLSAGIFAVIHIEVLASQPFALLGLFTVGFLLAWAYHLTGNLTVPILGHAVFNAISLGLTILADRLDLEQVLEDLTEVAVVAPWLVASLPGFG
ncbi:MAG: CPBP family intramembrane glutamic endopeptidase [Actinomycetota bacterium]